MNPKKGLSTVVDFTRAYAIAIIFSSFMSLLAMIVAIVS